jgi:hypothetical protein
MLRGRHCGDPGTGVGAAVTLQRHTPLKRAGYIVKRRPRRLSRAGADPKYRDWVRAQPCVFSGLPDHECQGRIEQSHERHHTGLALKAPDKRSVPMCSELHRQWEGHSGVFSRLDNLSRFALMDAWIAAEHARYEADGGVLA